jgi:phosphoglycolate phosphatase
MSARILPFSRTPIRLVVFDWDGTVVDSVATIANSIQTAARDLGLTVPSDQQARHVIGLGLADALRAAVPDLPPARQAEFVARYRYRYLAQPSADVPFAGMPGLLKTLASTGLSLAVATGKSRRGLDRALSDTGLGPFFKTTRCGDEGHAKPHPWMLQSIAEALDIPAEAMVMIGDTSHDIEMARAFGARSIGVSYGAHAPASLRAALPDALAGSVDELGMLLAIRD